MEVVTAQPGVGSAQQINNWFWDDTVAGDLLWRLRETLKHHADELIRLHAGLTVVPRAQVARRKARANPGVLSSSEHGGSQKGGGGGASYG
jgi:hypothetical protein